MKILATGLALAAAVVLGIGAFAMLNLRALIGAHHDRLVARVARIVGRPLTVAEIVPSWWPLGIRLRGVTVGEDPGFGVEPFLTADGVVMGVRAWPLVRGRIEAAGVTLEAPRLRLVRDTNGNWNVETLGSPPPEKDGEGRSKSKERRVAFRVPFEWIVGVALSRVSDGTVTVEDRRRAALVPLVFRHVTIQATDVRLGATARMHAEASLFAPDARDVRLDVRADALGETDLEHASFAATLEVSDADLSALSDGLGRERVASGKLRRIAIEAGGTLERLRATLAIEAVDPALRAGAFPLGALQPLTLRADVARAHDAITIEDVRATIGTLAVHATGDARLDPARVALVVTSEREGHAELVLDRGTFTLREIAGNVAFEKDGVSFDPLAVQMDDVPLSLRGWVTGVEPLVLDLRIEGRPFGGTVAADVAVDATGGARAHVETAAVDLGAVATRFVPEIAGKIEGRMSGAAVVTGRLAAGSLAPGSLGGSGSVAVTNGRLRDVNLADRVVDEVEDLPFVPTLVSPETRARYAELFGSRDTVVESATVPFTLARGRVTTDRAVLVNPAYQITGDGWIDEGRALRFHGTVLLGASVSRTLRDDVRAAKYLATDDGRIGLPFVARGRLDAIRVEPDGKRLRSAGLEALLGTPGADAALPGAESKKKDRRRDEPLEDQVIERLQRLLRP